MFCLQKRVSLRFKIVSCGNFAFEKKKIKREKEDMMFLRAGPCTLSTGSGSGGRCCCFFVFFCSKRETKVRFFSLSLLLCLSFSSLSLRAHIPTGADCSRAGRRPAFPGTCLYCFFQGQKQKTREVSFFNSKFPAKHSTSLSTSRPPPLFEKRKEKEEKLTLSPPRTPAGTRATAPACPPSPRSAPSLLRGGASSTSASSAAPRRRRRRPRSASAGPPGPATGRGGPWRPWRR